METQILYYVAVGVGGAVVGILAGRASLSKVVKELNNAVNVFRGEDNTYTPKQNLHWLWGEYKEHKDELATELASASPDDKVAQDKLKVAVIDAIVDAVPEENKK